MLNHYFMFKIRYKICWIISLGLLSFSFQGCDLKRDISRDEKNAQTAEAQPIQLQDDVIEQAFLDKKSNIMVVSGGYVVEILPEDKMGVSHQRFVVRLKNKQVLVVSHNIDLAPRIKKLKENDYITFKGEYEWSESGGVIHWTHLDPLGQREGGWIEHKGIHYE